MDSPKEGSGDFSIGGELWPGISKLIEECGEVIQVCGKLIGSHGDINHWDGTNLKERLEIELADLLAAISFVIPHNNLDPMSIEERRKQKIDLFYEWPVPDYSHRSDPYRRPLLCRLRNRETLDQMASNSMKVNECWISILINSSELMIS